MRTWWEIDLRFADVEERKRLVSRLGPCFLGIQYIVRFGCDVRSMLGEWSESFERSDSCHWVFSLYVSYV